MIAKLSRREREILAYIERQANVDIPSIRRSLRYPEHAIRYIIAKFRREGVILQLMPMIDPYQLGYVDYTVYFSLTTDHRPKISALISYLSDHPSVLWLARLGGRYHYAVSFLTKHVSEVRHILDSVVEKFGIEFNDKAVSTRVTFNHFSRQYLAPHLALPEPLSFGERAGYQEIDEIDHSLLIELSNSEDRSLRGVAQRLSLSHSTVHQRCKKLEERGIINGYAYLLNPFRLQMQVFKLLIQTHPRRPKLAERIVRVTNAHANIVHLVQCVGPWDYEMGVEVSTAGEVEKVIDDLCKELGNEVRSFQILPILEYLKFSSYPFKRVPTPLGRYVAEPLAANSF